MTRVKDRAVSPRIRLRFGGLSRGVVYDRAHMLRMSNKGLWPSSDTLFQKNQQFVATVMRNFRPKKGVTS